MTATQLADKQDFKVPIGTLNQSENMTATQLADKLRKLQSWREVETAVSLSPELKVEAWQLLNAEQKNRLKELKRQALDPSPLKVGDLVRWHDCPFCLEIFTPFVVRNIRGDWIELDWISHPIHRSRLILEDAK